MRFSKTWYFKIIIWWYREFELIWSFVLRTWYLVWEIVEFQFTPTIATKTLSKLGYVFRYGIICHRLVVLKFTFDEIITLLVIYLTVTPLYLILSETQIIRFFFHYWTSFLNLFSFGLLCHFTFILSLSSKLSEARVQWGPLLFFLLSFIAQFICTFRLWINLTLMILMSWCFHLTILILMIWLNVFIVRNR